MLKHLLPHSSQMVDDVKPSLHIALPPPQIKYMATTGLGAESSKEHARMYKMSAYGSELTPSATLLCVHYLRYNHLCPTPKFAPDQHTPPASYVG